MRLRQRTLSLSVMVALLLGCGARLLAGDAHLERKTLKGIKGIQVLVEDLPTAANRDGLTVDQIRTDVELRLRKAGVQVLEKAVPFLYIRVSTFKSTEDILENVYAVGFEVSLEQAVVVVENSVLTAGTTWSVSNVGIVGLDNMSRFVRDVVGDLVDQFLNAYLSVNPKQ